MKLRICQMALALLTLACMAFIFGFSAQSAAESGSLSANITQPITDLLLRDRPGYTEEEAQRLFQQVDEGVRIVAHFSEYALLGLLLHMTLRSFGASAWWLTWLIGTAYAVSDEWHQTFSPQRSCELKDMLVDSLGVLAGVAFTQLVIMIWRKKHVHHP